MSTDAGPFLTPEPEKAEGHPQAGLWLLHLFVRPARFFAHFPRMATSFTVAYSAWIVGIAGVMDRLSWRLTRAEITGRPSAITDIMASWPVYWAACAIAGALAAVFLWGLGGWWYRVRLRFSGASAPKPSLARRVYIFACMVAAFPMVVLAAVYSLCYATPLQAEEQSPLWLDSSLLIFLFWSVYTGYRGARVLFDVVRWQARVWFLLVPAVFYLTCLGGVAAFLALLFSGVVDVPPDVSNPAVLNRPGFWLHYPGNWSIDRQDEDYDPDHCFLIEPDFQDAAVIFYVDDDPADPAERTALFMETYQDAVVGPAPSRFERWGDHHGAGTEFEGDFEGGRYRVRIFSMSGRTRSLTAIEIADLAIADSLEPGFALIRDTLRLRR